MFRFILTLLPALALAQSDVRVDDITYVNLAGGTVAAYLVSPPGTAKTAGALFVHWLEEKEPNSNRTQFLNEAKALARGGLTSLLIDAPWSKPGWYRSRDVTKDYENSQQQVKELRHALDLLLKQPRVDPNRVAYIGHDFGAMYGVVAAAEDDRIKVVAFQAFTGRMADWFLYNQRNLTPTQRQQVIDRLAPFDALRNIPKLQVPILLQFANEDFYVPKDQAQAIYNAANQPKQILWYESGHGLNEKAAEDRQQWLRRQLALK